MKREARQIDLPFPKLSIAEQRAARARMAVQLMSREAVVTYAHAGRLLGITRSRARQLAETGELRTTNQDGRTYVTKASLDALLAKRSRNA